MRSWGSASSSSLDHRLDRLGSVPLGELVSGSSTLKPPWGATPERLLRVVKVSPHGSVEEDAVRTRRSEV